MGEKAQGKINIDLGSTCNGFSFKNTFNASSWTLVQFEVKRSSFALNVPQLFSSAGLCTMAAKIKWLCLA